MSCLLVAAVAGLAGEASGADLTAAVQGRALLAMRFGGVIPGAEITAPAQHVAALAAIERFFVKLGTVLELQGAEPVTLRLIRDRVQERGANAAAGTLTPFEAHLAAEINVINYAHASPAFKELRQHSTRGGG